MHKPYALLHVSLFSGAILAVSIFLVAFVLPLAQFSPAALAQELPPRPTLTPADEDDGSDEGEQGTATPVVTATLSPTAVPTLTPTEVPPTPMSLPVTGGSPGNGQMWLVLTIGALLFVCAISLRRAMWLLSGKGRTP